MRRWGWRCGGHALGGRIPRARCHCGRHVAVAVGRVPAEICLCRWWPALRVSGGLALVFALAFVGGRTVCAFPLPRRLTVYGVFGHVCYCLACLTPCVCFLGRIVGCVDDGNACACRCAAPWRLPSRPCGRRVYQDCVGYGDWVCSDGLHRVLCAAPPHPCQQHPHWYVQLARLLVPRSSRARACCHALWFLPQRVDAVAESKAIGRGQVAYATVRQ